MSSYNTQYKRDVNENSTYFFRENLLTSTSSSGAVIKSMSCPISVWNVGIIALPAEMLLKYSDFEYERVVDGDLTGFGDAVPAGLASVPDR